MAAPGSPVEQIKEKLDIVEFLKGYVELQQAGKNFKALCPFHKEKTASFMISPDRQSWHCFGCGIGGDQFSFLMRYENIEFGEALRTLAEKAGVELQRMNPGEYKLAGLLYDINDAAKVFFKKQLPGAAVVKQYLAERGLQPETIEEFEVGWAPNEPEALTLYLLQSGYVPEDLVRAGVSFKTERGLQLDRFRGRIMFPIENHLGKTVGFTGRILPQLDTGTSGKYVNSPETAIFNKSKLLYGFSKTKNAIREAGSAFLVEGQMDCIMSYQAGVKNVVATSGTALTLDHLRSLRRAVERIVLSFDSDDAGLAAGERAIDLAEAADFEVRVIQFTGYKDPAEAAQADGEKFREAVLQARPAMEFYFERYLTKDALNTKDRAFLAAIRVILGKIKAIASPVSRSVWLKDLSRKTGVDERFLNEEAEKMEVKTPATSSAEGQRGGEALAEKSLTRRELLSERLLAALVARNEIAAASSFVLHLAPRYAPIAELLTRGERKAPDADLDERLNLILMRAGMTDDEEIERLKQHLFAEYVRDRRRELAERVREAERSGEIGALETALRELQELPAL